MKIILAVVCLALADARGVRKPHIVGPKPRPIEFHGIQGVDLDSVKPPEHEAAFDRMREEANLIELKEEEHLHKQLEAAKKVEREFLNSDLHKQALTMKLFNVPE